MDLYNSPLRSLMVVPKTLSSIPYSEPVSEGFRVLLPARDLRTDVLLSFWRTAGGAMSWSFFLGAVWVR